jgi:glutamate synthase domain-containing protein 2
MYVLCSIPYHVARPIHFHPQSTSVSFSLFFIFALWWDSSPYNTTHRKVYDVRHEWACHSMFPEHVDPKSDVTRCPIGTTEYGTKPYSSSILNISAMSYGALSDNAIKALNNGARLGSFSHNTGEGGVSKFHREGGDIVWNIGTGYFGCGMGQGEKRVFDPILFKETLESCDGKIKMIEVKLSQGAKPGHGGLLPRGKITKSIAEARKIPVSNTLESHFLI